MIPQDYYYDWTKVTDEKPWKGQIVEVLTYQPAIYLGENEYGCDLWDQFPILDKVVYWRVMRNSKSYAIVYQELLKRKNQEASAK